jgi:uncharacterized protein YjiS (DUF1127 family)
MASFVDRISARRPASGPIPLPLRPWLAVRHAAWSVLSFRERMEQRQALLRLNDNLLKDIGLTRADVEWECSKPFWRG